MERGRGRGHTYRPSVLLANLARHPIIINILTMCILVINQVYEGVLKLLVKQKDNNGAKLILNTLEVWLLCVARFWSLVGHSCAWSKVYMAGG